MPYLEEHEDIAMLFDALWSVQAIHSLHLLAYVILPDHFHGLLNLERSQPPVSNIVDSIKKEFTSIYKDMHNITSPVQIWQKRSRKHVIRDGLGLEAHFDYIHWNPVKHGYVRRPEDWPYSTYSQWCELAYYPPDWGLHGKPPNIQGMCYE